MNAFTPRRLPLAAILCSLLPISTPALHAQTATTTPVGFVTLTVAKRTTPADDITDEKNFLSLPLTRPIVFQGVIQSASGGTLTFAPNTFTAGQFSGPHYIELQTTAGGGASNGVVSDIASATTNTLVLADNYAGAVTPGATIAIVRPHWTFATAFGLPSGFQGGSTAASADVFTIVDPTAVDPADRTRNYYFDTDSNDYRRDDGSPANDAVISLESGIQVARRSTTPVNVQVLGAVKTGSAGLYVAGDSPTDTFNLISNPFPLGSKRLDQSNLVESGFTGGNSTTSDLLRILDPQLGLFHDFFFETSTGKWKTGFTDASLYEIPSGASAAIIRKATRPSFTWLAPQPTMNLTDAVPALTLASAVSRKVHAGIGVNGTNFLGDVNLPLLGSTGVEPRRGSIAGSHAIILTFSNSLQSASNPSVAITAGTGSVSSVSVAQNQLTVNLTGVANAQTVSLSANNVVDVNGQILSGSAVSMRFLQGDINAVNNITTSDTNIAKFQSDQVMNLGNFRADTNANGLFTTSDVLQVKSLSDAVIP